MYMRLFAHWHRLVPAHLAPITSVVHDGNPQAGLVTLDVDNSIHHRLPGDHLMRAPPFHHPTAARRAGPTSLLTVMSAWAFIAAMEICMAGQVDNAAGQLDGAPSPQRSMQQPDSIPYPRGAADEIQSLERPHSINIEGELFRGAGDAPVVIIEYGDYMCPYCSQFEVDTYPVIRETYVDTGKVKFLYRNLVGSPHETSARAATCAREQGRFWEMHQNLYTERTTGEASDLHKRASALGLRLNEFESCMGIAGPNDATGRAMSEAKAIHVLSTPTFLIGTVESSGNIVNVRLAIVGAYGVGTFKAAIEQLLRPAHGSAGNSD